MSHQHIQKLLEAFCKYKNLALNGKQEKRVYYLCEDGKEMTDSSVNMMSIVTIL